MKTRRSAKPQTIFIKTVLCTVLVFGLTRAQVQAPVEKRQFHKLTSYEDLQSFLKEIANGSSITVERLATSKQQRDISLVKITGSRSFAADAAKLRVLIFAQQHGDEPSGKEAMTLLLARAASGKLDILHDIDLMIVPQMNPDGAEAGQRRTSEKIDLNRSHVLLSSPETKALHDLYTTWMPHVTVDIHEYGSFGPPWSDLGMMKTGDVQLGMLTNANTSPTVRRIQHDEIYPAIAEKMKSTGYSFHEYIVGSPDLYIRHSTTEINDGRQSFGILGSVSFIQEGRKWKSLEDQLERRAKAQLTSIEALLNFAASHADEIRGIVEAERKRLASLKGTPVAMKMDHVASDRTLLVPVKMLASQRDTMWSAHPYLSSVVVRESVSMPAFYLIPSACTKIITLLRSHQVELTTNDAARMIEVTRYNIVRQSTEVLEEDTLVVNHPVSKTEKRRFDVGDVLVPTNQLRGLLAALILEPSSTWGITKYAEFEEYLWNKEWPIYRIEQ